MRGLPDKCFELAIADPPYGDGHGGGGTIGSAGDLTGTSKNLPPPTTTARKRTHYAFGIRKSRKSYQDRRNMGDEIRKKNCRLGRGTQPRVL